MNKFKAIVLLGIPLILVIAAIVLIVMNIGNPWTLHFYTVDFTTSRAVMMLIVAAVAVILWWLCRWMLPAGFRALSAHQAGRRAAAPRRALLSHSRREK